MHPTWETLEVWASQIPGFELGTNMLFVSRVGFHHCLRNMSIFAVFSIVLNLLCKLPLWGHTSETRALIQWRIWNSIDLPWFPSPQTSRWHGVSNVRIPVGWGNRDRQVVTLQGITISPCRLPSILPPWLPDLALWGEEIRGCYDWWTWSYYSQNPIPNCFQKSWSNTSFLQKVRRLPMSISN